MVIIQPGIVNLSDVVLSILFSSYRVRGLNIGFTRRQNQLGAETCHSTVFSSQVETLRAGIFYFWLVWLDLVGLTGLSWVNWT